MSDFNQLNSIPRSKYFAFKDLAFVVGDSPATHDIEASLSREGIDGWLVCDGDGDIDIELSSDGTTFGDKIRLIAFEILHLSPMSIKKIRITHTGTDSAYRGFVI